MCVLDKNNGALTQMVFHNLKFRHSDSVPVGNKRNQAKLLTSVYYSMWSDSYQHFGLIGA